ncbi:hypothetical protein J4573_07150 [Actinomadura barringtoniae]|uniref:PE-PGRS family protein n=1 Tax=Actinomadura barringtoniae TaxID=1427535 RepID=A0A939P718_9ACTN|nr:DUF5954 family protein [Actinomadura barringtoniae]MBO2446862.1 hypothetical protein [Actinomadura barringtoniae]
MSFPLMPGYDHINVVADLDPAAAVRDRELGDRTLEFGKLVEIGAPDFGYAVQKGTEWRILSAGGGDPEGARYSLAIYLRQSAIEGEWDPETADAMRSVAARLDPEEGEQLAKDEWEIGDRRYRVIRITKFTLIGNGTMEPPRPTDTDPPEEARFLDDYLIDPRAPAGQWEANLRLNLVGFMPPRSTSTAEIEAEARHAIRTHPGVILLPPTFTVVEIEGTKWKPFTGGEGPEHARHLLARYFGDILPRLREFRGEPATDAERAEWAEAERHIEKSKGHDFHVMGRHFRTIRISRMLRLGRDGPEAPRASDQERFSLTRTTTDEET